MGFNEQIGDLCFFRVVVRILDPLLGLSEESLRLLVQLGEHPVVVQMRRSLLNEQMPLLLHSRREVHVHRLVQVVLHRALDVTLLNAATHNNNLKGEFSQKHRRRSSPEAKPR